MVNPTWKPHGERAWEMQSLAIERSAGKISDLITNRKDLAITFAKRKIFEESFLSHTATTPTENQGQESMFNNSYGWKNFNLGNYIHYLVFINFEDDLHSILSVEFHDKTRVITCVPWEGKLISMDQSVGS